MKIEIFKVGRQTDSAGNSREWTEADLDTIASSYKPANHEAPVCIGHPKDNAPAWAWVKSVSREGTSLFAEIGDIVTEFGDMLKKKMFKKRSISLYPDLSLRHIGFLGAQPPAVKGLEDFAFAEKPAGFEYADWDSVWSFQSVGRLFQGLRDWIIETKDLDTANKVLNQYDIDPLKSMKVTESDPMYRGYTETTTEESDMDKVKEQEIKTAVTAEFAEKLAAETTRANAAELRATTAEAKVVTLEKSAVLKELTQFCDRLVSAGKMLPAQKANHIVVMESIAGHAEMDFSEGEGATAKIVKKSPLKAYQENLENGPKVISFGEQKPPAGAPFKGNASDKLTELSNAKMKEDGKLTFGEASKQVLRENPDLEKAYELEMA